MNQHPLLFGTQFLFGQIWLYFCCHALALWVRWMNSLNRLPPIPTTMIQDFQVVIFDSEYHKELYQHIQITRRMKASTGKV